MGAFDNDAERSTCTRSGAVVIDHQRQLTRAMLWLGSASLVSKVVDALSLVVVLGFLSREQLGLATLAWSVTTFLESLNGLGISAPVIQRAELSREERASAHWYAVLVAFALTALVYLVAPVFAAFYGAPELTLMTRVAASKLVFVGLANVPLALLSREMRFNALGAITGVATILSSGLAIALAAGGAGAWAPLLGNTAHGLFQLLGVCALAPVFPRPELKLSRIRPLISSGLHVAAGGALGQVTRNLDYFVVGQLAGLATLGTYRVAFDLAMAPTLAILQVITRSAFPVYARLAADLPALIRAFCWTIRSTCLLVLAPLLLVFFVGDAIFELLSKSPEPHTDVVLHCLCLTALLRAVSQPFSHLFVAMGRARRSLVEAIASTLLLTSALALWVRYGVMYPVALRVALGWLSALAVQLLVDIAMTRVLLPGIVPALVRALRAPLSIALLVALALAIAMRFLPVADAAWRVAAYGALLVGLYLLGARVIAGVRVTRLFSAGVEQDKP